ncbi:GPI inositol-deacylase [Pichia californica]|uniref:GPI inositol-deacylase n=1 Tax=Pichia californica TaxID=460514 RepID=A0A9P6WJE6_9ASCO|nr:GPI inositol-deacylase [[Candida] californica]KAG0688046.1 GPI inositol-deacylase [[Candida] californica]
MSPNIVYIHPTLLLSLSDHLHRASSSNQLNEPIIGLMLGKSSKQSISLLYAFEISNIEKNNKLLLENHLSLLSEIYGKDYLQLIGFYIINSNNNINLLNNQLDLLNNLIFNNTSNHLLPSLISSLNINDFLFLDYTNSKINIHSAIDINIKIPFQLRYMEAEKISISTYNNIPKLNNINNNENNNTNNENENIKNGLQDLSNKLNNTLIFLNDIKIGKINIHQNNQIYQTLQSLSDLTGQIKALKFKLKENNESTITNNNNQLYSLNSQHDLNKLISITSLISSIFYDNLSNSI